MKRITAILLAGLFLSQTFSYAFEEILKLDEFIEHAQMHSKEYGDSFFTFISKHYGEQKREHSNDHQEHENLPLNHHSTFHLLVMFIDSREVDVINSLGQKSTVTKNTHYLEYMPELLSTDIFQPPKVS